MEIMREIQRYPYARGVKQEVDLKSLRLCEGLALPVAPRSRTYNEIPFLIGTNIGLLDSPCAIHCVFCTVLCSRSGQSSSWLWANGPVVECLNEGVAGMAESIDVGIAKSSPPAK
jgi:hypothetical protein